MPYEEDTVGEIQRPLIFRLKSRFQLKEIIAQRMHVGSCVYPITDIDRLLGVPRMYTGDFAGTGAADTFVAGPGALACPVGKRWHLIAASLRQVTAVALSTVALAFTPNAGGTSPAPSGGNSAVISPGTAAGVTLAAVFANLAEGLVMDPGDAINGYVIVTGAASTYRANLTVFEEDFRENVV